MQDIWKTYMVPITISAVGLVIALVLGLVPLLGQDKTTGAQRAAMNQALELTQTLEDSQAIYTAQIEELRQILSSQARTISDFDNRLANLDRGVTQTFWRSKGTIDLVAELRQAVSSQTRAISDLENRSANLDRGVTRTFWRSKENTDFIGTILGTNQRLSDLETQMNTLNAAVPRISTRVRELREASE